MNALNMINAERCRQIEVEGWSIEHDDQHTDGSLYQAALAYLRFDPARHNPNVTPERWPASWNDMWFKPRSRTENLVRAGALCMAEKARIARAGDALGPRYKAVDATFTAIIGLLEDLSNG